MRDYKVKTEKTWRETEFDLRRTFEQWGVTDWSEGWER